MRIKNKEIRSRRHRKEQKIKDAAREVRAQYGEAKPTATAPKKAAAPKAAAKKTEGAKAAPKKTAAPKAKKAEPKAE